MKLLFELKILSKMFIVQEANAYSTEEYALKFSKRHAWCNESEHAP